MKKLLIGILVPTGVIGGGGTTLYMMLKDSSTPTYVSTGETINQVFNRKIFDCINDTKDTHKIDIEMTQDDFNQILAAAYSTLDESATEYIKGFEIAINEKVYHIYIWVHTPVVDTKIDLTCSFDQDDENFYLVIDDIKAGSLGLKSLALSILKNVISSDDINKEFEASGVHMTVDLDKGKFTYPKADARNDLVSVIKGNGEATLASSLFSNVLNMDLLSLDFTNHLQVVMDIEPLNTNEAFCNDENILEDSDLALETSKENLSKLLEAGIVDTADKHCDIVFKYLTLGYDALEEDAERAYIDSLNLTSIGITNKDKASHLGYQPEPADVADEFKAVTPTQWLEGGGLLISEGIVNQYIQYQDLIGYSFVFTLDNDVEYITVDNFYVNLLQKEEKEQMNMVVGINISGYETSLILENTKSETTSYGMKLQNDNIYFGSKAVDDELKGLLYGLVKDNLPENDFLTFDGQGTFTVNFEGYLSNVTSTLATLGKTITLDSTIEGASMDDTNAGFRLKGNVA